MSDNNQTPNFTIQAVEPVGYFSGLARTAGRILISGLTFLLVLGIGNFAYDRLHGGAGLENLLSGNIQSGKAGSWVHVAGDRKSHHKLLVLDLSGLILGTPPYPVQDSYFYSMYDVTFGYQLRDQILAAAKDDGIEGILIHARTPGGTIFGSQAIHDGIVQYREETGKPVAVWVEGMSASGGVYSTAGASAIYAAPGSAVGSIGVIGGSQVYYNKPTAFQSGLFASGVVTQDGIEVTYMHAGRGKDAGNPFRRMTEEERQIRQVSLDRSYAEFVDHVARGRGIDPVKIVEQLGAHIYGNVQAAEYGLIDATLSREEAYEALARLAGIEDDDYAIVRRSPPKQSLLEGMMAEETASSTLFNQLAVQIVQEKCQAANQISLVFHGSFDQICNPVN